jgi:hypothetical protein
MVRLALARQLDDRPLLPPWRRFLDRIVGSGKAPGMSS